MRRRLLLLLIFPSLLFAAAWSAAWFWAAANLRHSLERWRLEQTTAGREVNFEAMEITGFPFRLKVRVVGPSIVDRRGWHWLGPPVMGSAAVWAPRRLSLAFPGFHRVTWGRRTALLQADGAKATVLLGRRGDLLAGRLELVGVTLGEAGEEAAVTKADRLEFDFGSLEPERSTEGLPFRLLALMVVLPQELASPLGREVARLALKGRLTGPPPQAADPESLRAWQAADGRIEVPEIALDYGPVSLAGEGTAQLDAELRPKGAFAARIAGLPEAVDRLESAGLLTHAAALTLKLGAVAAASERDAQGRALVVLPIMAADGLLFLGPIALLKLEPLA